jgi:hypothetical protein
MNIRKLMIPKSEDEILNSIKGLSNSDLLQKSIKYEFIKGIELVLQQKLTYDDIHFIKYYIFNIKNKEVVRLMLEKVRKILTDDQIYIIEKYQLDLHLDKEKDYEIWFKEMLTDLDVSISKTDSDILIYKKNGDVLYKYNEKDRYFYIDYNKIWFVFKSKFHLNNKEISLLTKGIVEEHFNLMGITTDPCCVIP